MNINIIKQHLQNNNIDIDGINVFINYCNDLYQAKNRDGKQKNPWINYISEEKLAQYFLGVKKDGLILDGKHVTIQSTGISYDYIAYKNKMLSVYPESVFDVGLVYKDDDSFFNKESGKVQYTHNINNPFGQNEKDIIGGYCVIKNKRGEFLTILNVEDLEKHRKAARTDYIWSNWLAEMYKKTIVKKACKVHFDDIFQNIETIDNENYDLEKPLSISIETKQEIEAITNVDELGKYYHANKSKNAGITSDFNKAISDRKKEIIDQEKHK